METQSSDEEPTSSDEYLVNKASSFSPKQSKVILGQLVNKMKDGISANDFRDIIASEPEDLKEGEVLRIEVLNTAIDQRQENEFATNTDKQINDKY